MKKSFFILFLLFMYTWSWSIFSAAKADEYGKAVVGHVITNAKDIDKTALLEAELQRLAHNYSIEMINILQVYLPSILDSVAAEMKQNADKTFKCALLKGTGNDCKNENN